jgi:hypothetical protein
MQHLAWEASVDPDFAKMIEGTKDKDWDVSPETASLSAKGRFNLEPMGTYK